MLYDHQKVAGAVEQYAEQVQQFRRGELSPEEFRPLRLGMGLYSQLAHVQHMQRIKISGGQLLAKQVEAIADLTERWGQGLAHVTTRQDIQIHHLSLEESVDVQRALLDAGVVTVGACADAVRNVTASHFAGVLDDEVFDVTPHAHAITHYFMFHAQNRRLPRKFKVGLSGSPRDIAQAVINDVGLFARESPEGRGFRVYVAGGLGSTPELAHLWKEFLPEGDLLTACEAVLGVFFRDGERKNRKKARLKFLLRKLGEAEFLRRLDEEFERLKADHGEENKSKLVELMALYKESEAPALLGPGGESLGDAAFARWKRTNTLAQKQAGYRVVTLKLPLGDITAEQLRHVARLCGRYGNGEVRMTNTQNIVMRWVPEGALYSLFRELSQLSLAEPDADHISDVVSCPGGDYCTLAITKSMGVAAQIRTHLAAMSTRGEADDLIRAIGPFEIKISGCPNSCGQHHVADIGLTGVMAKDANGVEHPHYSLRLGGGVGLNARLGDRMDGRVPEAETPKVIAAIAKHYVDERAEGERFREFVERVGVQEITRVGFGAARGII